ncbi:unnamed protein product [Wuchereria bancrofti]|uniref:Uncharacterized protein n=1 Tax=Wuchereria bancrofti TaxID=6293 RepID=A0A3P7E133_WUCBA|nr:unnamed protein product [Wuchereria bancrofti]
MVQRVRLRYRQCRDSVRQGLLPLKSVSNIVLPPQRPLSLNRLIFLLSFFNSKYFDFISLLSKRRS